MPKLKDFEANIDKAFEEGIISEKAYQEAKNLMGKPEKKAEDLAKMGGMFVDNAEKTFKKTHPNLDQEPQVVENEPTQEVVQPTKPVLPGGQISKEEFLAKKPQEESILSRYKKWAEDKAEPKTGVIPDEYGSVVLTDPLTRDRLYFDSMDQDTLNDYKRQGYGVEYAANSGKQFEEGTILRPSDSLDQTASLQPAQEKPDEIALGQEPIEQPVEEPIAPSTEVIPQAPAPAQFKGSDPFKLAEQGAELEALDARRVAQEQKDILDKKAAAQLEKDVKLSEFKKQAAERIEEQRKKNQQAIDEYKNTKVTAPSMWDNKSTGAKILAGIGLFLGAMPNSTGQNTAVAVLEKEIARNMDAQKENLRKMKEGLDFNETVLTDLYKQLGDEEDAINAYANIQLNELNRLTSISSNEKIKANEMKLKSIIGQQREALRQEQEKNNISKFNAETSRMNTILSAQSRSSAAPKNKFVEAKQQAQAKQLAKDEEALRGVDERVDLAKRAWNLSDQVSTGPVVGGAIGKFVRRPFNKDFQELETIFSNLGLDAIKKLSQEGGGAKSVDSDAEKKFILNTVPELSKDPSVNKKLIATAISSNKRQYLDTIAKRTWAEQYGNLDGYKSPTENLKSYINLKTGDVEFFEPGKPKEGYTSLSNYLATGGDSASSSSSSSGKKPSWAR